MSHLETYLRAVEREDNTELAEAIVKTANEITPYLQDFTFKDHVIGLLVGNVQSGKTSHMFGIMNSAADEGFGIFVLLTTDNILLQQQTLERAEKYFTDFCICGENDYLKFVENKMIKPSLIVLKKNPYVLKQWKNDFASTKFCKGNPLFIVDDEADAASLNTFVNKDEKSTINKTLEEIKETTSSSIYLQVTATPQSIILQTEQSGWKPYFIHYFEPGKDYIGGNFFFTGGENESIILTDDNEAQEVLMEDELPENGLKEALNMHLITAANILLEGGKVCNFMIHPSVKIQQHTAFAEKVGKYLNDINNSFEEDENTELFEHSYNNLKKTKNLYPFDEIMEFISELLKNDKVNVLVINSESSFEKNTNYNEGVNILVGGNSLGRGLTIPQLQTIYYCRLAKSPQADTMWQHSRIFGYDRDKDLIRVFMPPMLFKLFSDINATNNSIINQIKKYGDTADIKIAYPKGLKPTRSNVIDKRSLCLLSGGVNYFPFSPINKDIGALDELLSPFEDGWYSINLNLMIKILEQIESQTDDFDMQRFIAIIKAISSENKSLQGQLLVSRGRDIAKGTGTLLSPNDRKQGAAYPNDVVLTLYKVTGNKGWGEELWIPNIKLPSGLIYYNI